MKHIKRFNESFDDGKIIDEIEESVKECLEDYITDYGMIISFVGKIYTGISLHVR